MWCRKRSRNWGVRSGRMETTPRTTMNQSSVSLLLLFPPTEEEKRKPRLFLILFRGTYYKGAPLFYKEHHMCRQKDHFLGGGGTKGAEEKSFSSPFFPPQWRTSQPTPCQIWGNGRRREIRKRIFLSAAQPTDQGEKALFFLLVLGEDCFRPDHVQFFGV